MTTSMFQYLEDMDNLLKENSVKQTQENLMEMAPEDQMINYDYNVDFNQDVMPEQSYEFDFGKGNNLDNDMFSQKLDLRDEMELDAGIPDFKEALHANSSSTKLDLSRPNETQGEIASPVESEMKEPEPKTKGRMSNKERARKARQRKKKYYEDLEKRCCYLEELCKNLTKELQFNKHKVRLYECSDRGGSHEGFNRDIRMIDSLIERAKRIDGNDEKLMKTIRNIQKGYSSMGDEKMKILDGSFDMFMENILCGTDFKSLFYSVDKDLPKTFAEAQAYLKMKKFQKYELYPDEKLRDFLDIKLPMIKTEEEYDHLMVNKLLIVRDIKEEIKEGIATLYKGKEIIYKALMKNDTLNGSYAWYKMDKVKILNYLEEMKHSNLKFTYKDAFDVKEEETEVEMRVNIPNPEIWSILTRMHAPENPDLQTMTEWAKSYKMNHLVSPIA
ncbi:unnamed protein product [Moneuplotes crassus]|uniref:BZIP domain-containing protein n=1 Tax=Euplotes crassus TaxID=5936 RepID=A0AAD1XBV4_EUPCR|nr:unnamed protein product [Moneuplotes crassus]